MSLLSNVKDRVNAAPAMEEYDIIASLNEDYDIIIEAMLGNEDLINLDDISDIDLNELEKEIANIGDLDAGGDSIDNEDPDLGEDTDKLDFSFESDLSLESAMGGVDEEYDFNEDLDNEDSDELIDELINAINNEDDNSSEEDD